MGLNHRIRYRGLPFNGANSEDRPSSITGNIAQIIREIPFTLPAKPGNAMQWNAIKGSGCKPETLQELQPVQQAVRVRRVLANLKLAQPDEPADPPIDII